jgi:hypothetical protein
MWPVIFCSEYNENRLLNLSHNNDSIIHNAVPLTVGFHAQDDVDLQQYIKTKFTPMLILCPKEDKKNYLESLGNPIACDIQVDNGTNYKFSFMNSNAKVIITESLACYGNHKDAKVITPDLKSDLLYFNEYGKYLQRLMKP